MYVERCIFRVSHVMIIKSCDMRYAILWVPNPRLCLGFSFDFMHSDWFRSQMFLSQVIAFISVLVMADCSVSPIVVFHQCMDREWDTWGRESALEMARAGFAVIRVPTTHWSDHKNAQPLAFSRPLRPGVTEREMICAVMMRDVTLPLLGYFFTKQVKDLRQLSSDWEVVLPLGTEPVVPVYDVMQ